MKVVIIGANRGIGLALVKQYLQYGAEVVAVCRNMSDALHDLLDDHLTIMSNIDVTLAEDREQLVNRIPGDIDHIIHNAGILRPDNTHNVQSQSDAILEQFQVNALAPLLTLHCLSTRLRPGAKMGIITSRMGSIADNTSGGMYGYRMSKAAVNMAGKGLAQDLREKGIAVYLLHPGFVQTDMTNGRGYITPEVSAKGLWERMNTLTFNETGTFWHTDGSELTW